MSISPSRKIRIFINGFGRIGRSAARIIFSRDDMELVGINDLYDFNQMGYLLKYDSVYGVMTEKISVETDNLIVDEKCIKLYNETDASNISISSLDIDVVLQCTGIFLDIASNQVWIENGAKHVVVSTPPKDDMPVFLYGTNHEQYQGESIVSNSSCSVNAIVPILKIVDKHWGVRAAQMHMFHSYTAYQKLLDSKHYSKDIRRARAAAINIIPLESSAADATAYFFPHLKSNLYAKSIRIPIAATTMYDLLIKLDKGSHINQVRETLTRETALSYDSILASSTEPKVSSDYIADSHSATIDIPLVDIIGGNLLRISAWQDNEYGYACRLVDMAGVVGRHI